MMFRNLRRCSWVSACLAYPWVAVGLIVWLVSVGIGMGWLASYSNQAGVSAPTAQVSVATSAATSARPFRLLMFAHPRCPCTAASLSELARLMSGVSSEVDASVYFYQPAGAGDNWAVGRLWHAAAAIPGVHVQTDPDGATAAEFGTTTSGDVLVYDASGRLRFQGGITAGRGHEGDNLGRSTVMSIVRGELTHVGHSPVFGCSISSARRLRAE